jgi:methionine aminopeptidase
MSIRTAEELAGMRRAGALVARTLRVLVEHTVVVATDGPLVLTA